MIVFPKLKTAIIESNRTNIAILQHHLNVINPEIEICGYAEDIPQAVDLIEKQQPDIIFLDIQLKDGLSFQVADIICQKGVRLGELIFLSSVDRYEYALKAMEYACLGFILKPITENAVRRATEKATQRCMQRTLFEYIMQQKSQAISEIAVPTEQNSKNLIDVTKITYFEAQGQRTRIHFTDCSFTTVARTLGYFKKQLANSTLAL